jgi:hypothetical protein
MIKMWLIINLAAAIIATAAFWTFRTQRKKLRLGFLSLMLWGTTIMVFVDHLIAFLEGEPFITWTTDGLIGNAMVLGIVMVIPIIAIWIGSVLFSKPTAR